MSKATFRFGVSRLPPTIPELRQRVENYEAAGFDFIAIGDHIAGGVSVRDARGRGHGH